MKYGTTDALFGLYENPKFTVVNGKLFSWEDERPRPSEEQIQAKIAELEALEPMRLLRLERNSRLAETDWRMVKDYKGEDQSDWESYRQALRDLPATAEPQLDENGMLTNVTWPKVSE